jgi:tRNA dimethylallyltransferase
LPVLVGGSGFYLKALLEGLFPGPGRDDSLRARLAAREARRPGSLHRILRRLDAVSARKIHPNDVRKTTRALEITLVRRQPVSLVYGLGRDALQGFRTLKIGLNPPRAALYERIHLRCERMFEGGLIEEVRAILAGGCPPTARPLESHGYKQALDYLEGRLTRQQALLEASRNTRNYAKRQWTWFRREADVHWYSGFGGDPAVREAALEKVDEFVSGFRDGTLSR